MTIGDLAKRSGLSISAIRYYQRRGLLPARDANRGWQRYDVGALSRLAVIELAKRTGFTLDEVAVLLDAVDATTSPAAAWKAMFEAKLTEIDERMQTLTAMRLLLTDALDCDCLTLEQAALVPTALGWVTDAAAATDATAGRPKGP